MATSLRSLAEGRHVCPCGLVHREMDRMLTCQGTAAHAFRVEPCSYCSIQRRHIEEGEAWLRGVGGAPCCGACAKADPTRTDAGESRAVATFEEGKGSIFDAPVAALVNPVNLVGTSGAGLAREFARRFPSAQAAYQRWCRERALPPLYSPSVLCTVLGVREAGKVAASRVYHLATKDHWQNPSDLGLISMGLAEFADMLQRDGVPSVAVPALGCGLGGLDWAEVKPHIVGALGGVSGLRVVLFAPQRRAP